MTNDLVARARRSYRSMSGVVVVSPQLLADLADALEHAAEVAESQMRASMRAWLIETGDEKDPEDGDFDAQIAQVGAAVRAGVYDAQCSRCFG